MGTDIHFVVQKKVSGKWEKVTTDKWKGYDHETKKDIVDPGEFHWDGGRNYYTFAWLADVRNGHGFAGVKTFEPVKPVTSHRGFPSDFENEEPVYDEETGDQTGGGTWMGDHSFGWASAAEILAHPRPPILQTGILALKDYLALRDEGKKPEEWSGGIAGRDIVVVDSSEFEDSKNATHVRTSWVQEKDYLDPLIDSMREMAEKYGAENVRIVFGFDS